MQLIYGSKAGQKKPHTPQIADDTVASITKVTALYLLGEGEIKGLVNGSKSIFFEDTPLEDEDGNRNFENVTWEIRYGTVDQTHIPGVPSASTEQLINTELRSGTPWTRLITDTQLSSININVSWPRLSKMEDNGDVNGTTVDYAIDVRTDGGAWITMVSKSLTAKTSGRYQRTHNIPLPDADNNWQVRVRKITEDGDNERLFNKMQIDSIAEIIDAKLCYPHSAVIKLTWDSRAFGNTPKVSFETYGRYIKVPTNYDPETRTSTGLWNGTFKEAYTTNPAWIYYDLITNDRYGLGNKLKPYMINKWAVERIARLCDEMVDDGKGGLEPRYTCNLYLQTSETAFDVLQHIAGIFRGMVFWDGSQIVLDADTYKDCDYVITRANVINGEFVKSGTAKNERHTVAKVGYSNPDNNYEVDYVYVRNERAIAELGINELDLSAIACTSEGEAYRFGLAALLTEQNRTQTISFAMGLDGALPMVGDRVDIADPMFTGHNTGGRISGVNSDRTVITVDRDNVPVSAGDKLVVNLESGKAQTREIVAINGREITVSVPFDPVSKENVWAVNTDEMPTMPFIVLSIKANEDGTQYNYTALQYDATLQQQIDNGTIIENKPPLPPLMQMIIDAPESVSITSRHRIEQAQTITTLVIAWDQVKDAVAYDVEWRKDDGDWIKVPRTGNISVEIDGVYSGNYLARVRAVSAFDAVSKPTTSTLTAIKGKAGKPPSLLSLKATGVLFGMELSWTFAPGSGDAAYTEIQVASAPDTNVALLGQYAYKTNKAQLTDLQNGLVQFYRGRIIDKLGFESDWTDWVRGEVPNDSSKVLNLIAGDIEQSHLHQELNSKVDKIDKIEPLEDLVGDDTKGLVKSIADERKARIEAIGESALDTDLSLHERADALAKGQDGIVEHQKEVDTELEKSSEKLTYLSSEIDFRYADKTRHASKARGTAWTFAKTVARQGYVLSELSRGISAELDNMRSSYTEQITANVTKTEAATRQIENLSAQLTGGYEGNELSELSKGLLYQERESRVSDYSALSEQISLLSAGVGEQFDPYQIWHFDSNSEGWTGGVYNSGYINARTTKLQSPAISELRGAAYHHIKMRIEKVGTPTWSGLVEWNGGSTTIAEPVIKEGIANVSFDLGWSGNISSFSIKVAETADNLNYFKVDWIAVGRPSPGASSSAVLDLKRAFSDYKISSSEQIRDLTSTIFGADETPLSSSIREQLQVLSRESDSYADRLDVLDAWYNGEDETLAAITKEQVTAFTKADQSNARKVEELSAEIDFRYADKNRYADKTRSIQRTFAVTVAQANYTANLRIDDLQSEFNGNKAHTQNELLTLASKDLAIASEQDKLSVKVGENTGDIEDLKLAVTTPETGLSARFESYQTKAGKRFGVIEEQQGSFSNELTNITGEITTLQRSVDGQTDSIEVITSLGDADKLKLEIAKARLDKDVAKLTTKKSDLSSLIAELETKKYDLQVKANQAQADNNLALKQSYLDQIDLIDAAIVDANAQRDAIDAQVAQLKKEKSDLDSLKQTESDVKAQHFVKIDANGNSGGFGLLQDKDATMDFGIISDRFWITSPDNKSKVRPLVYYPSSTTINGVTVPSGLYLDGSIFATGSISGDKIRAETEINAPKISGGQININNKFMVDSQGNLTAKSGRFEGTVLADKISGTIDVESMKRSAWMGGWTRYFAKQEQHRYPRSFSKTHSAMQPSLGSAEHHSGESFFYIGSVLFEMNVVTQKQVTVSHQLLSVDDQIYIYINGKWVAYANGVWWWIFKTPYPEGSEPTHAIWGDSRAVAKKGTNSTDPIPLTLPKGDVKIQVVLQNGGGIAQLVMVGDFIDNKTIKFA